MESLFYLFSLKKPDALTKFITTIFENITDEIPAPLMLKLTEKIIIQWDKLSDEAFLKQHNIVAI